MLWAALSSTSAGPDRVWVKQVRIALHWLEAFFSLSEGPLTKVTFADAAGTIPIIMFAASTIGGGALLRVVPASADIDLERLQSVAPWAYLACSWTSDDEGNAQLLL